MNQYCAWITRFDGETTVIKDLKKSTAERKYRQFQTDRDMFRCGWCETENYELEAELVGQELDSAIYG